MSKERSAHLLLLTMFLLFMLIVSSAQEREPAPRFSAKTMSGEKFTNATVKGKVVLLQFWATWCPYCRGEQELVDRMQKEFGDQGLVVLAIDVGESKKKVKQYLDENPRECRIVLTDDTNLAAMFAATRYPIYVVIDRDGNVSGQQNGASGERGLRYLLRTAGLQAKAEAE
jgi:thiol-disulfide isomerase/thioredoxin